MALDVARRAPARPVATPATPEEGHGVPVPVLAAGSLCVFVGCLMLASSSLLPVGSFLLAVVAASLVPVVRWPAWGVVPMLAVEYFLDNFMIPNVGASARLVIVLAVVVLVAPSILRSKLAEDGPSRRVLLVALLFAAVVVAGNVLHESPAYVVKYGRYQFVLLCVLTVVATVVRTRRSALLVAGAILAMALASAVCSILQHYNVGNTIYADASAAWIRYWKGRSLGLSTNPVVLGNALLWPLMIVLGFLVKSPLPPDRRRMILAGLGLVLLLGTYFSYTRSALFAMGPGIIAMALLLPRPRREILLGGLVGLFILFQLLQGTGVVASRFYRNTSNDRSAASREPLWTAAIGIIGSSPIIGVGHSRFEELSKEYAGDVAVTGVGGESALGHGKVHNDFLNVWMSWGMLALVAYVGLFAATGSNLIVASRDPDPQIAALSLGTFGALVAYGANSVFHNYLDSSMLIWAAAGLSVALRQLAPVPTGSSRTRRALLRRRHSGPVLRHLASARR